MKKLVSCFLILLYTGCTTSDMDTYHMLVEKELSAGKRVDSIFFGIYFGMTSKEFFGHCWEMNKKGLFTDGLNNSAVLYKLDKGELKHPASMNFYPDFKDNRINKMGVRVQYNAWAPWNKQMFADSLLPDILHLYSQWYKGGNPFIEIHDKNRGTLYVKVDGNRRIIIGKMDDMQVKIDFTDLTTEKSLAR